MKYYNPGRIYTEMVRDHLGHPYYSIADMCRHYGVTYKAFRHRIDKGLSLEEALERRTVQDHLGKEFDAWKELKQNDTIIGTNDGVKTFRFCVLLLEGYKYKFSHRLFQEYFSAYYLNIIDDDMMKIFVKYANELAPVRPLPGGDLTGRHAIDRLLSFPAQSATSAVLP